MRNKNKKKMHLWEKIFIISSIVVIISVIGIYSYRLVHYYVLEHPASDDNSLSTYIINKGIVFEGDGLYISDEDEYYYKGTNVDNYVWFSGRMWRIVSINDGIIKMITDDNETSLVWGTNTNYSDSFIYNYLNTTDEDNSGIFLKSIDNYTDVLVNNKYSTGVFSVDAGIDSENTDCYVGLIDVSEYLLAGGTSSYLNNSSYFWTSNKSSDDKIWYISNSGSIGSEASYQDISYGYGIRPVISISSEISYLSGDGSESNPYTIRDTEGNYLSDKAVGDYVVYNNYTWRIQSKDTDSVKLILEGYVMDDDKKISITYDDIDSSLEEVLDSFDIDDMRKCSFNKSSYDNTENDDFSYASIFNANYVDYIGIPSIGDVFIGEYDGYWLGNATTNNGEFGYMASTSGRIISDDVNTKNYLRIVICLSSTLEVSDGNGTEDSPYLVGGTK